MKHVGLVNQALSTGKLQPMSSHSNVFFSTGENEDFLLLEIKKI